MPDICRNCGEELNEGAKFCGSCGAKVEPVEAPVIETSVAEESVAETPVAEDPVVETPVAEEPVVEVPVAEEPAAEAPAEPAAQPEIPEQPAPAAEEPQPVYPTPDQPGFTVPEMPDRCPDMPPQGAPGQYFYGAPAQQPPFNAPAQPADGAPAQQPPYSAPVQQPPYGTPAQPPYGAQPAPENGGYRPAGQPQYAQNGQPRQNMSNGQPPQYGAQPPYGAPRQQYGAPAGQPQPAYYAPNAPQPQPKKKGKAGLIIGIVIGAVVIIAGIVLLLGFFLGFIHFNGQSSGGTAATTSESGGSSVGTAGYASPEDAVAAYTGGIEALVTKGTPFTEIMQNCYEYQYCKPSYKSTIDDTINNLDDTVGSSFEMLSAYADSFSVSYKDLKTTTMTASEQKDFIEDNSISAICETANIEEICTCSFTMVMSFSGIDSESESKMIFIKADGRWYLSFNGMAYDV